MAARMPGRLLRRASDQCREGYVHAEPGFFIDDRDDETEQTVSNAECTGELATLPVVDLSELLRDLASLRRS